MTRQDGAEGVGGGFGKGGVRLITGDSLSGCGHRPRTGQTGRYVLIQKLRGTEGQLVADDCPLESLFYLGQLAIKVKFILRYTGPSSTDKLYRPTLDRVHP